MSRPAWNDRDVGGYLGRDPELRFTKAEKPVTNISIACPLFVNKQIVTEWVNAVLFGHNAEFCCKYAKKGDLVRVTGYQLTKKFTHNGVEKESIEVQGLTFAILRSVSDKAPKAEEEDAPF